MHATLSKQLVGGRARGRARGRAGGRAGKRLAGLALPRARWRAGGPPTIWHGTLGRSVRIPLVSLWLCQVLCGLGIRCWAVPGTLKN